MTQGRDWAHQGPISGGGSARGVAGEWRRWSPCGTAAACRILARSEEELDNTRVLELKGSREGAKGWSGQGSERRGELRDSGGNDEATAGHVREEERWVPFIGGEQSRDEQCFAANTTRRGQGHPAASACADMAGGRRGRGPTASAWGHATRREREPQGELLGWRAAKMARRPQEAWAGVGDPDAEGEKDATQRRKRVGAPGAMSP